MRLLYPKIQFLLAGTILLMTSCEKDTVEPLYNKGVLTGTTFYYDETVPWGGPLPLEKVTVTAKGPYGSRTAVTDASGKYEMNNLGNGTYEVSFTKKGWGGLKQYSVQIYGNDSTNCGQRMWKRPEIAMPAMEFLTYESKEGYLRFRTNLSSDNTDIPYLRAFYSKTSDVSCVKYTYSSLGESYTNDEDKVCYLFGRWFSSDEKGYIIFYIVSYEDQGYYDYDYFIGIVNYPSIDPQKHSKVFKIQ
jgi:hypothetical protein